MSIINKMLQELDRRQGMADPEATSAIPQVRIPHPPRKDREWFWRIIAVLMVAAVAWVAWIAWQLQPRAPIVTEQAFKAAESAKRDPKPVAAAPKPVPDPAPAAKVAPEPAATFQMAPVIEAPIAEQSPKPAAWEERRQAVARDLAAAARKSDAKSAKLGLDVPAARVLQPPAQTPTRLEKRDRTRSAEDRADAEFRRAAALLNQGRVGEAEEGFSAALGAHPGHEPARQALIALYLEQRRMDEARRLLQEGMALNPANTRFASVLARIFVERKDYSGALDVLDGIRSAAADKWELQGIRGTVLQRLGRHADAVEAFRMSLKGAPQSGPVWLGLGISLESLGRKSEAAEAFKRAASTGTLGPEARGYAEQRSRQLQ